MRKATIGFAVCLALVLPGCGRDPNIGGASGGDAQPMQTARAAEPAAVPTLPAESATMPTLPTGLSDGQGVRPIEENLSEDLLEDLLEDLPPPQAPTPATVIVSGKEIAFDGQQAVAKDGEVFVPVKGVFEHLDGANGNKDAPFAVDWDGQTSTATIKNRWYTIIATSGEQFFYCNGERVAPAAPPQAINGEFMLPLMAIANAIDATAQWDKANNTVSIFYESMVISSGTGADAMTDSDAGELGGELAVAAFNDSQFLQQAARRYEEMHEGAKISVTYYVGEEKDAYKYSQIINAALMSGRGEDIIDVSCIPWWKLADKDKLFALDGEIGITPEAYYQNVMDAYIYKGRRYTVPLGFAFEAFQFGDAFADKEPPRHITLGMLLSLADKYPGTPLFNDSGFGMGQVTLAYKLFGMYFGDFVDVANKNANVGGERFITLLENVKSIAGALKPPKMDENPLIRQLVLYSPAMSHMGTVGYENVFLLADEAGQSIFLASGGLMPAVNANSPNKELAIDFIRFLISEDIQSSPELTCCPVNKKAALESARLLFGDLQLGGYVPDGFGDGDLAQNIAKFDELVERLSTCELAFSDVFIRDFAMAEMGRFFRGEASAEQAAKNLQAKLNTYLKE